MFTIELPGCVARPDAWAISSSHEGDVDDLPELLERLPG